ncbi:hypothetical protein [Thiothrix sp.]|jgi:hypothetical protein|uniref:hypothetical protein n=1 Tax=Thiothrix sp. TaxID=1032 RepID=UPI0025794A3F|nr:hypothetical protein [Thiothrix sp.]
MSIQEYRSNQPSAVEAVKKGGDYWFCHTNKYRAEITSHDVDAWKMNGAVMAGEKQSGFTSLIYDAVIGAYQFD